MVLTVTNLGRSVVRPVLTVLCLVAMLALDGCATTTLGSVGRSVGFTARSAQRLKITVLDRVPTPTGMARIERIAGIGLNHLQLRYVLPSGKRFIRLKDWTKVSVMSTWWISKHHTITVMRAGSPSCAAREWVFERKGKLDRFLPLGQCGWRFTIHGDRTGIVFTQLGVRNPVRILFKRSNDVFLIVHHVLLHPEFAKATTSPSELMPSIEDAMSVPRIYIGVLRNSRS